MGVRALQTGDWMAVPAPPLDQHATPRQPTDGLAITREDGDTVIRLTGVLGAALAGELWRDAMTRARAARGQPLIIDLGGVTGCDMAGAVFLVSIEKAHQAPVTLRGGGALIERLFAQAADALKQDRPPERSSRRSLSDLMAGVRDSVLDSVRYVGELAVAFVRLPRQARMLRARDLTLYAEQAGIRSLPLVVLLGYLMGLILAFQSVIPMRRFGAEIYVANLVAVSLLRELGPLLAAVILAGRTASAFAAEIGTMKVNEELNALVTMGIDPMTMLVLPRVLAVMLVMPVMTLVLDIAGLAGMTTVMRGFGFPWETIARQVQWGTTVTDLMGGLFKAACFGMAIAAIGCRAGLATGNGPRAVGLAATGAVVGGIVATILLDGLFALLFYRLHL